MNAGITKILNKLEKRSSLEKTHKINIPSDKRMLAITKETGELINMLLFVTKAKNILEVGTSTGYSTLWCADIIRKNSGIIFTIEKNREKIDRAKKNFLDAGVTKNINIINGIALEILEQFNKKRKFQGFFDFALIDADKENVIQYFDLIVPLVRKGGIIMTDNMLYPKKYRDRMRKLSSYIKKNTKIRTITCPIGHGEEISVKI